MYNNCVTSPLPAWMHHLEFLDLLCRELGLQSPVARSKHPRCIARWLTRLVSVSFECKGAWCSSVALEAASSYLKLLELGLHGKWSGQPAVDGRKLGLLVNLCLTEGHKGFHGSSVKLQEWPAQPTLRAIFLGKRNVSIWVSFCACPIWAN